MASKQEKLLKDAEDYNSKGSEAYKAGKFVTAAGLYAKAAKLNKSEPKYYSNISAAFFEAGDYLESLKFIAPAWDGILEKEAQNGQLIEALHDHALLIRLATRYAKAKINALCEGKLSFHRPLSEGASSSRKEIELQKRISKSLEKFALDIDRSKATDTKVKDLDAAWKPLKALETRCSHHTAEQCDEERQDAQKRFRSVRIFKSPLDPAMEYFKFGHDDVQSLLWGLNNNPDDPLGFTLDSRIQQRSRPRKNYTFLFGGSGDARHVFALLVHLADFTKGKNADRRVKGMAAHFTLVDIHPATLARALVIFSILQEVGDMQETSNDASKTELLATAFYIHTGVIMPESCCQVVMRIATRLAEELPLGTHPLQKIFHVNTSSLDELLKVLRYWTKPLAKTISGFFTRLDTSLGNCKRAYSMHSPEARNKARSGKSDDSMKENLVAQLTGLRPMGDWGADPNAISPQSPEAQKLVNPYEDSYGEADIWDHTRLLLPPKRMMSGFPELEKLVGKYKKSLPASAWNSLKKEVEEKWKVNPTLFDLDSTENLQFGGGVGYPTISGTPYDHLFSFAPFNMLFERSLLRKKSSITSQTTGFDVMGRFFELVAEALCLLRNALKVEIVVGDVILGVAKLVHGDLGQRPKTFPDKWMRMFLSNVPDYTHGALNTSVHLAPYMETDGVAIANCLLNTGLYSTVNHQVASYALMPASYFPKLLGTNVLLQNDNAFSDIVIQAKQLPLQNEELGSKRELHFWLARLLLCTLSNGRPTGPPLRVDVPNNIHAFFHILVHLHRIGFPTHWLGEFVQAILDNKLVTDAVPYTGTLPVPLDSLFEKANRPRSINLAAWNAEIKSIIASFSPALPFALALPEDFPVTKDVKRFKVNSVNFHHGGIFMIRTTTPFCPTAALLFYKDESKVKRDVLVKKISTYIEGDTQMKDLEVQILLGPENVNMNTREVAWKMTEEWYTKMKKEGWKMTVWRTDQLITITDPIDASRWDVI